MRTAKKLQQKVRSLGGHDKVGKRWLFSSSSWLPFFHTFLAETGPEFILCWGHVKGVILNLLSIRGGVFML